MLLIDSVKFALDFCKDIESALTEILNPIDIHLNLKQLIILSDIKNDYTLNQSYSISKSIMSHNLNKLIKMGLINKITNYCTDHRRIKFELTDKGEEILNRLITFEKHVLNENGDKKHAK